MPIVSKKAGLPPPAPRVKRRCLGPGKEHEFMSTDVRRNKVCGRCAEKQVKLHLSLLLTEPPACVRGGERNSRDS